MSSSALPADLENQTYVTVKAIVGGKVWLPIRLALQDSRDEPDDIGAQVPVFSFLIEHPTRGKTLFDLGIRKNGEGYPPALQSRVHDLFKAECPHDVADQLRAGGVKPEEIDTLILSHLHWDHIGDPSLFPTSEIVMGGDIETILPTRLYPQNPRGSIHELPKANKYTFINFKDVSSTDFKSVSPLGTFTHAIDFFGDGSLYLIDTPGHCPGHICALARVAANTFVFLAGDLCHHREAYDPGVRLIGDRMYEDIVTARETVTRLVKLNKEWPNVIVILAHEPDRLTEGLPLFPEEITDWVLKAVEKRRARAQVNT
ncbi:Metallo-hydrolase/oxidoreductase [Trametopsis cervina]|nr:Metallo-hydrolase/oxidoreductase [Trametopsis cervina]